MHGIVFRQTSLLLGGASHGSVAQELRSYEKTGTCQCLSDEPRPCVSK